MGRLSVSSYTAGVVNF